MKQREQKHIKKMNQSFSEHCTYLELENWKSLPVEEKTISATSASQRIDSSSAFLNNPFLLLEKVTCLAAVLSILLSLSFSLAMVTVHLLLS